jgi:hypothetical protein
VGTTSPGEEGTPDFPLWEYKVIHLNVNDQRGSAGQRSESVTAADPSSPPQGHDVGTHQGAFPFSRAYLEQEFPGFYADRPEAESSENEIETASSVKTPAEQLQGFLNRLGCAGWNLLGIFPVGSHQMLVLSRPTTRPKAPARPEGHTPPRELLSIIERLERLEAARAPSQRPDASDAPDPNEALTSAEAATRIGFRSLAPLITPLREAGEPVGLQRRGPNGLVAEYLGIGLPARGGRPCRLWRVKTEAQANN